MSLPAASLSAFFASSLRWLLYKLWRGVGEDVEAESTMGFMEGSFWVLLRKLLVAKEAGTAKEGTLILARKEGWYCQGSKADTGKEGGWYCQGRKLAKEAPRLMG